MVRLKEIPNWQNIPVKYGYLFNDINNDNKYSEKRRKVLFIKIPVKNKDNEVKYITRILNL